MGWPLESMYIVYNSLMFEVILGFLFSFMSFHQNESLDRTVDMKMAQSLTIVQDSNIYIEFAELLSSVGGYNEFIIEQHWNK